MQHDEFFWLGQINKASIVINTDEQLLEPKLGQKIAHGLTQVLDQAQSAEAARPSRVIEFEPLLIKACGPEATFIHAGRSSQDMHATFHAAILREEILSLTRHINAVAQSLITHARRYKDVIVPNYTNGVAAQPNAYAHQLLAYLSGIARDIDRLREVFKRVNLCAMGATVLNGTGWPLDRKRMAEYLGFAGVIENAYDATQILAVDGPVEVGQIITSMAIRAGNFVQDIMSQYVHTQPWILLGAGSTYVSSAMPQKRNPGLLVDTRIAASNAVNQGFGPCLRAHNLPTGMYDAKMAVDNSAMVTGAIEFLDKWNDVIQRLEVNAERALEELNTGWTASQELADRLMRDHNIPFRIGHHFASDLVIYASANALGPKTLSYTVAQDIYRETVKDDDVPQELPLSEPEFRAALNPMDIVNNRQTLGGPQPSEIERMLNKAQSNANATGDWVAEQSTHIANALAQLDSDFRKILTA